MELLANLATGFQTAFSIKALLFCLMGVTFGNFIGVLPGIGPMAAISMLLPFTFYVDPTVALIMLAGIYYGAQYGGSTASILLNLPGTASTAITCLDGYPLTKQGRGGVALFITTFASFFGSSFAICILAAFAPSLAEAALSFGSAEYFAMMFLGLIAASSLSVGSPIKGISMVFLGILLGMVGMDVESGRTRFTYGLLELQEGLNMVAVAMGLFGVAEILASIGARDDRLKANSITWRSLIPTGTDLRQSGMPILRGSVIGTSLGVLPGAGPSIASFLSYAAEKRLAKDPSRFGKGAIEGIASPEASNNAAAQASFIPTLTLGIPGDAVMALMLGALMIHGITPGPMVVAQHPDLFWGLVASFWIGNVVLVVLNLPLIGVWVRMLAIPYHILFPSILFFICLGVYGINNSTFDILLVVAFGALGYGMIVFGFPAAPLLLGLILGPLVEEYLRRALVLSRGDLTTFIDRPISAGFLAIAAVLLFMTIAGHLRRGLR